MSDRRPALPEVQSVHWLDAGVLPPGDPNASRLAVVLHVPASPSGTVSVVVRSDGVFSRLVPVQGVLWPAAVVAPAGRLDDAAFAAVRARFSR